MRPCAQYVICKAMLIWINVASAKFDTINGARHSCFESCSFTRHLSLLDVVGDFKVNYFRVHRAESYIYPHHTVVRFWISMPKKPYIHWLMYLAHRGTLFCTSLLLFTKNIGCSFILYELAFYEISTDFQTQYRHLISLQQITLCM